MTSLFFVFGIAHEPIVVDLNLTLPVTVLDTQLNILAKGLAFLLSQQHHDGKHNLALEPLENDGIDVR